MIVAIEGIDASGKATQTKAVAKKIAPHFKGIVNIFDFPHYSGVAGSVVGHVLRGETVVVNEDTWLHNSNTDAHRSAWSKDKAIIIQSLMITDRLEHQDQLKNFENNADNLIILDRYGMSGIVYGQADGLDRNWLIEIHKRIVPADMYVLLDISVEESERRRPGRRDYYERNFDKLKTVRDIYLEEFIRHEDHRIVDGALDCDQVTDQIVASILAKKAQISFGKH